MNSSSRDLSQTSVDMTSPHPAHTPGPWRIEGRRGPGYIISAGTCREGDGPESYVGVLDPMFYIAGEGNHAANVGLIVEAPAMAGLLKNLLDSGMINGLTDEFTEGARKAVRDLLTRVVGA